MAAETTTRPQTGSNARANKAFVGELHGILHATDNKLARRPLKYVSVSLVIVMLAFVLVRLPWMFTVPMQEAPDEFAHYWVIKFITEHWRLPTGSAVLAAGPSAVYGSLPQLGYIPHVLTSWLGSCFGVDIALGERFGSLLAGLVLLWASYHLGSELFPRNRLAARALPLLVVMHPQLIFLHGYANCDSTSSALATLLLLIAARTVRLGVTYKRAIAAGIFTGWLVLSKYAGAGVVPVVVLAVALAVWIHKSSIAKALGASALAGALAAGICLPWFARNLSEFPGDMLGTQTMYKTWATTFERDLHYKVSAMSIIKELRWWRMMFFSFWGMFGYMNKYLWRPVYIGYVVFLVAAAAGWLRQGVMLMTERKPVTPASPEEIKAKRSTNAIWALMALAVTINLGSMIWASTVNLGGPQGRYLLTSEVPVLALLVAGLLRLWRIHPSLAVTAFVVYNTLVASGSWLWLHNLYGWHWNPLP